MATISLQVTGGEAITRKLRIISEATSNMKAAFKSTGDLLVKTYKDNFEAQGRKLDTTWAARTWNYDHPILNKTGKMKEGFRVAKVDRFSVTVENPVEYAKHHQYGTKGHGPVSAKMLAWQGGKGMIFARYVNGVPARPIIGLGKILIQDIIEVFNRYLNERIKK